MKKLTLAAGLALGLIGAAHAQSDAVDAVAGLASGWSGSATLGATSATGNTEASSISGGIRLGKTVGKWEHLVFGSVLFGRTTTLIQDTDATGAPVVDANTGFAVLDSVTDNNAERIILGYQPKYYWRPRTYFFGILDFEFDEPANIDQSTRQIIGVGHKFWASDTGFFSGEAGFGNRVLEPVVGDDASGGILYFGLSYLNQLTEALTFNADFKADLGGDNTGTELNLGLAYKVSSRLALKLAYFARGNTDLENPGNPLDSSTDTVTTFNLVFDI